MESSGIDKAVLEMEKQVNTDKAGYFRRLAAEANGSLAIALREMADRFDEVAGVAAALLAATAKPRVATAAA